MHRIVALLELEAFTIVVAYLKAGIPVGGILLAGRMSPLYRLPTNVVCRWWSRVALLLVAVAVATAAAG